MLSKYLFLDEIVSGLHFDGRQSSLDRFLNCIHWNFICTHHHLNGGIVIDSDLDDGVMPGM